MANNKAMTLEGGSVDTGRRPSDEAYYKTLPKPIMKPVAGAIERQKRKNALNEAFAKQTAGSILSGAVKPPKSKAQGDVEVMSKRRPSIESQLRKDF